MSNIDISNHWTDLVWYMEMRSLDLRLSRSLFVSLLLCWSWSNSC